jgi:Flp pilus assembly protein TadG
MWMRTTRLTDARGQSVVEMAILMPLVLVVGLGVIEFGYALLDQHVVTKLTREGSNLISRDTTIDDAITAMRSMSTRPVDFSTRSRVIFSVLKKGATTSTANYDQVILYQRAEYGSLAGTSGLQMRGSGTFGAGPDYVAANSDTNTGLQISNLPSYLDVTRGGLVYVTEIFTTHNLITPLDRFGVTVPNTLYSIAYF